MSNLLFYRASAGSGKTHMLVIHYVKLVLKYPDSFKNILAVTFTNLAAQEMKQRILLYLYNLSIGEFPILQDELCKEGWNIVQIQERSRQVLSLILHHYEDFSVTTLDSFFYKVVQAFVQEFGLKHDSFIEMDQELVLEEVIEVFMNQLHHMPLVQQWMIDFALYKLRIGHSWNIKKDIQNFSKEVFTECFKIYEEELLPIIQPIIQQESNLQNFVKNIQDLLVKFETKMQDIGKAALFVLNKENLTFKDFAYGNKGVLGYFLKLANKKSFKPTQRAILAKNDIQSWISKTINSNESVLTRVIVDSLLPLLLQSIALYQTEGERYHTALLIAQNIYLLGIIGILLVILNQYKIDHNLVFISDITWLIYQNVKECETPFFYEHIGNQYQHLLIDEFQDLSMFQWINIKPLIKNSVAQGYNCLLVGDMKQSIYRWRGSHSNYLNLQVKSEFPAHALHTLTKNRRSKEIIVLFNNHILKKASSILVDFLTLEISTLKGGIRDLLQREINYIQMAYSDIVQDSMSNSLQEKGSVELVLFKQTEKDGNSKELYVQKELIQLVEKLKKEGIPAEDIVFLVRNNEQVNYISTLLQNQSEKNKIYPIISNDARYLWKNPSIKILIYALYYLLDNNNYIHTLALVQAYMSYIQDEYVEFHNYSYKWSINGKSHIELLLPENFVQQKGRLKHLSIYACVEELITMFFGNKCKDTIEVAFFQSIVLDFFSKEGGSIPLFLKWWEKKSKKIKLPISNCKDVMRVMTIHQAKGLEFKVVIIPFCNWNLDHSPKNSPILWVEDKHDFPFSDFPILPLRYNHVLKDSYYAQDYFTERIECCLDNFNLLYVAFTRAKDRLYLFMPTPKSSNSIHTVADLVYRSVTKQQNFFERSCKNQKKMCVTVQEVSTKTVFLFH